MAAAILVPFQFQLEHLTIEGGEIEGSILQNMNVRNISLSSKIALDWLPRAITSLEVRTLNDEGDLSKIFNLYPYLKSFHIQHPHSIASGTVVEIFEPAFQGKSYDGRPQSIYAGFGFCRKSVDFADDYT